MATTLVQVRGDDELKNHATAVYDELGIDLSTAVRMFLNKFSPVFFMPFYLKFLSKIVFRQFLERRQCPLNLCSRNAVSDPHESWCTEVVARYEEKFVFFCLLAECIRIRFRGLHEEVEGAVRVDAGETVGS